MGSIPHQIYHSNSKFFSSNSVFINSFYLIFFTMSTYLEYLLQLVYIPSRIVMKDIFLNEKIYLWIYFVWNFNSNFRIDHQFRNWIDPMCVHYHRYNTASCRKDNHEDFLFLLFWIHYCKRNCWHTLIRSVSALLEKTVATDWAMLWSIVIVGHNFCEICVYVGKGFSFANNGLRKRTRTTKQ